MSMGSVAARETLRVDEVQMCCVNCFMHNPHLIVKGGLQICDLALKDGGFQFHYFGSVAKVVNVWREVGKDSAI